KPMLRVGGKPILELLIERLRQSGIVDVMVALRHKSELIREHLGDGERLGVRIEYVEEPEPLGTMGALTLVRNGLDLPFFVVNGDILTKCDFRAMWEFHRARVGAAMTVGVSLYQIEIPYGEFALRGERIEPGVAEELPALLEERLRVVPELPREPVDGAVLCVSTPVDPVTREPVLEPLRDAARAVAAAFDSDTLVVVRSTVPVGASRAVVLPELVARWGRARLAFCPERTIQGQALREPEELPQIVGGLAGPRRAAAP